MERFCPTLPTHTLSHSAFNNVVSSEQKRDELKNYGLTRETRATVDQVLDPRTIRTLTKLQKQGYFTQLHGAISTGKEANVYLATSSSGLADLAVKVYKTSILVFKDRSRYVEGEFRFRGGCAKGNPRKMVALWAEKELRNLRRLKEANILCPEVLAGRDNVIVMRLVSYIADSDDVIDVQSIHVPFVDDAIEAPMMGDAAKAPFVDDAIEGAAVANATEGELVVACKLKDAYLPPHLTWLDMYKETMTIMRSMFQTCCLVHGDLSEYNLLFNGAAVVVIDVSQSVEHEHPYALDFLKRDCVNVNAFFRKVGVAVLKAETLFEWVVRPEVGSMEELLAAAEDEDEESEELFMNTFTPTSLYQVGDLAKLEETIDKQGRGEKTAVDRLLVSTPDAVLLEDDEDEDEESDDFEEGSDESEWEEVRKPGEIPADMTKAEWKKKIKEEKREKRKNKIPKKDKKKEQKKHSFRK